jgi:predicted TIM-barrel fold metal-dependent hydrolase
LGGFGEFNIDEPHAVEIVDRFHDAGFRGLGEMEYPRKNYDDQSYWPVYERAEKYGMIILFHAGIVSRNHPETPTDVSSDRMRVTRLDLIARRFPKIAVIGAHLGNPDYAWAAEIGRWNPNIVFDVSGSSLIKKQDDYAFFKSVFWWTGVASPHTPSSGTSAFEKLVFGSDCFDGDLAEFDLSLSRYQKMLADCGVPAQAQANIFSGTAWRILNPRRRRLPGGLE